ncbi:MAG: glycoside hydrolase family 95 protein [Bacteroidaceae bacterium]|nr:glycoside hydrolase family 95 protein [Bacteroidaceae bacterium]
MKKIYLMLVSFICAAFAVQAETRTVTDLSQLSNDKVYAIRSARAFLMYSTADGVNGQICSSTGKSVGAVTQDPYDVNQQFRIESKNGSYYLYSMGAEKYVGKNGSYSSTATDAMTITNVGGAYPWKLLIGGNGMNSQEPGQMDAGIVVNGWTTTDPGNCYIIDEVITGPKDYTVEVLGTDDAAAGVVYEGTEYKDGGIFSTEAVVKKSDLTANAVAGKMAVVTLDGTTVYVSYFDEDTKFYTIQGGHGGFVSMNSEYTEGGNLLMTNSNRPHDNKGIWAFVSQAEGKYKVYNYSTGLSKVLGIKGTEAAARATMVTDGADGYSTLFSGALKFNSTPAYIKIDGSNNWWNKRGNFLALWNTGSVEGDTGSKFFLTEVDPANYPDIYYYEVQDITGVAEFAPKNPNTLWYRTSAEASGVSNPWMEYALPLGNGELGCMVFGGVHNEELQFNEKTLWSGPANVVGAGGGNRTFMNFGSVFVENKDNSIWEGVTDYVRYLDIEEGIAGVQFKNGNGSLFTRKYFSSAPDQVIVGQYKAEGEDKMNLNFTMEPGSDIGAGSYAGYENGMGYFTGAMTSVNYAARLHVVADEGAIVETSSNGILVKNATEVTFYLKGATNFNGDMEVLNNYFTTETPDDVNARVKGEIEAAVAKGFAAVEKDHIADFTAITKRMTFDLGLTTPAVDTKTLIDNYFPNNSSANSTANDHLFLEQLYFHYGRYLAISSNRKPIAAPNNLQGIWNDKGTDSPWNSDIHTNINIQMNYWPTEITNLSDLHKPYVNFIIRGAQSDGWKEVAKKYNNGYGWSVLTESSLYNSMSTWGSNYLVANVWYTSHLWTHYRYTQDKEFLKKAFPVMWSCAEFWFHRLIEDRKVKDGTFVAPNEFSAEQHGNESEDGTAHAQQMISYLFQNLTDAIDILGVENTGLSQADIEKLALYLEKTDKGLHTETYDGAWGNPFNGVKTGDVLLREWKYSPYSVGERGHRHISHLMALFPMDQITPESEYFVPAVNALKHRGDAATGWSMGWKVNLWARAQDGDHAHIIIKNALKHSTTYGTDQGQGGIYYNLFDSHAPFQIDGNFGVCSGMAEMLLQSAHGYVNILPALPAVWKKGGNVTGMKAMGNFTVDFNWVDGKCQKAVIVSNAGAELKVRCKIGAMDIANAKITVNGVEVPVTVDKNGIVTIPCAKDDTVEIDFTTETSVEHVLADAVKNGNNSIYDLEGRRVNEVLTGRIYIQNGKKQLAK